MFSCLSICFSPRSADSIAANMLSIAPKIKDTFRAGRNAFANVCGNHVVPCIVFKVVCGMAATTDDGKADSTISTGLYPKKAENNAPVGGMLLKIGASCAAPMLVSEAVIASGNL